MMTSGCAALAVDNHELNKAVATTQFARKVSRPHTEYTCVQSRGRSSQQGKTEIVS